MVINQSQDNNLLQHGQLGVQGQARVNPLPPPPVPQDLPVSQQTFGTPGVGGLQ